MNVAPGLAGLWPLVIWNLIILLVACSAACMAITLRWPRRMLVYGAGGFLAAALIASTVPFPHVPTPFAQVLGALTLILATIGGGPAAQLVLALATRGTERPGIHGGIVVPERAVDGVVPDGTREVLRGGTVIGLLERFATAGALLAGFPEAIAVIIGLKGVGRFTELDAAEARERFIIGSFVSLIWACAASGVFVLAVR